MPQIDLGFDQTNDPAAGMFTTTSFQGASAAQLTDARALYGLLTGRVRAITGQAALDAETNTYVAFAPRQRAGNMDEYSAFIQDSWRMTPTLTINAGIRWDVQMPFAPSNDVMTAASLADMCGVSGIGDGSIYSACNFFHPAPAAARRRNSSADARHARLQNRLEQRRAERRRGVAAEHRERLLAHGAGRSGSATIRAGYSVAYERQGLGIFTGIFGANPGSTLSLTRDVSTGLVGPGETWPVLLREPSRLYNAPFPTTPTFPIAIRPNRADNSRDPS